MKTRAERIAHLLLQLTDGPQWSPNGFLDATTPERASSAANSLARYWLQTCIKPQVEALIAETTKADE